MPRILIHNQTCKGCLLCIPNCKPGLLRKQEAQLNRAGYFPVDFDDPQGRCTGCKACALVCPDVAIRVYR